MHVSTARTCFRFWLWRFVWFLVDALCLYSAHVVLSIAKLLFAWQFSSCLSGFWCFFVDTTAADRVCRVVNGVFVIVCCWSCRCLVFGFNIEPFRIYGLANSVNPSTPEESGRACRQCWEISATLGHGEEHPHGDKFRITISTSKTATSWSVWPHPSFWLLPVDRSHWISTVDGCIPMSIGRSHGDFVSYHWNGPFQSVIPTPGNGWGFSIEFSSVQKIVGISRNSKGVLTGFRTNSQHFPTNSGDFCANQLIEQLHHRCHVGLLAAPMLRHQRIYD